MDIQAKTLRKISSSYDRDKKFWAMAVSNLEEKIKVMKEQHFQLSSEAHKCANSIPDWTIMISAVQSLVSHCEDLKVKYNEEHQEQRKLYNQVQEAKGNIRVFCQCRPLSKTEVAAGHATVVDFDAARDGELRILTGGSTKKKFSFDRVYTPKDDQVNVFADTSPLAT
ncbi:kinesin-like protein KIN-14E [Rhododendron vialii]|uniref:kinesin-like protein KIN-14E n=1 Tax=Rhododendron vialii TaxID=182163 RepID=UPI0026602E4A|nr:kinesin-like protein KIN-14E [Rhododendron vialii]XP_058202046.1 kinesin-like protein KIN-14E [Rhododendron vialii]